MTFLHYPFILENILESRWFHVLWQIKEDLEIWEEFQNISAKLFEVSMLLIDNNGNPLSEISNCCSFCSQVKSKDISSSICFNNDFLAASLCIMEKKDYFVYRCYHDIVGIVFPIYVADRYIGALFISQFKLEKQQQFERLHPHDSPFRDTVFSPQLNHSYTTIPTISNSRLNEFISYGQALVKILSAYLKLRIRTGDYQSNFIENLYTESTLKARLIDQATALLNNHTCKLYKLHELSKILNCSESTLKKHFEKYQNENFSSYYSKIKINNAKKLLIYTHELTGDIARKLGYSDATSFHKKFKKETGMTMTEFRNRNKIHYS